MKKILASILTLALLVGILPAALGAGSTAAAAAPKSMKILTIGEDFSRTSMQDYLQQVLEAEGYEDIVLGHLYKEGYTLGDYVKELSAVPNYLLTYNYRGYWDYCARYTVPMAVAEADWDYIVLQTEPLQSGQESEFSSALATMVSAVKENATNPDVKIGWHVNWPYQDGYANDKFTALYGGKADTMYKAIAQAAEKVVLSGNVDFLVPAGTAVLNAESSFIGDLQVDEGELVVDGSNLNETGKLVTAYTFYAACSGAKLQDLPYHQAFLFDLSSAERKAVAEAVNNAIKNPCKVTESSYKTEPVQYNVTVNGTTQKCLPGDTVTISTPAARGAGRKFQNWSVVKGSVSLSNAKALDTSFKVPAQDVEVKAVYEAPAEKSGQLMVGFARSDATPSQNLNLSGYYDDSTRVSQGRRTPEDGLYFNAVAVSDGKQTNIIVSADFNRMPQTFLNPAREKVEELIGIPVENIVASATHTHSGPRIGGLISPVQQTQAYWGDPNNEGYWYYLEWVDAFVQACVDAVSDLKPVAETKTKSVIVPGMNWIRHVRYSTGVMAGANFSASGGVTKGFVKDADQELQLIRFVRDDAEDVVMMNWQAHNTLASGTTSGSTNWSHYMISGDFFGVLYRYVEANEPDCHAVIYAGASGDVVPFAFQTASSGNKWKIKSDNPEAYVEKMGNYVVFNLQNMTSVETGKVQSMRQEFVAIHHKYQMDPVRKLEQDVITIGDSIAFVTAGYEMADEHGRAVKDASPYDTTFVLSQTQWNEYIGSWQMFNYPVLGGAVAYESSAASCNFLPGTGEDLVDGLISMLDMLNKNY